MKTGLLHYSAPPVVGGVESVLADHARLMSEAGHQVVILAGRGRQFDEQIKFVHLPLLDSRHPDVLVVKAELDRGQVSDRFSDLTSQICEQLKENLSGIDVVFAHNVCGLHKNLPLTAALRRLLGSPGMPRQVLWYHDLAWTAARYQKEMHPGFPWDLLKEEWPGAIPVVISEARQKELASLLDIPVGKIQVVPNGVDQAYFLQLDPQAMDLALRLNLFQAAPLFLLPVRITSRKNIEMALRILAALLGSFPRAALVVTGPLGPHNPANVSYFERLISLRDDLGLQGKAHFLAESSAEFLPYEVISALYRLAGALLIPSLEEGFGLPILEAGLARLPIFCSDIPPFRELGYAHATFFSLQASPEDIARQITNRLRRDKAYGLHTRAMQEYSWDHVYSMHIAPLLEMS